MTAAAAAGAGVGAATNRRVAGDAAERCTDREALKHARYSDGLWPRVNRSIGQSIARSEQERGMSDCLKTSACAL